MSKAEANAALIREYIESVQALEHAEPTDAGGHEGRNFYSPDISVSWTGRSPIAGDYSGEEFYEQWLTRWAPYDVRIVDVIDILASDTRAAVYVVEEYRHRESGEVLRIERFAIYEIEDDQIISMTVRDTDQYASDDFWTRTQP